MTDTNDRIVAGAGVVGRTGATEFEVGHLDDTPDAADARWWASARYRGTRQITENHRSPADAIDELVALLLEGGLCTRCGRLITVGRPDLNVDLIHEGAASRPGRCRWLRHGDKWVRGEDCTSAGDLLAGNRAARRARDRRR